MRLLEARSHLDPSRLRVLLGLHPTYLLFFYINVQYIQGGGICGAFGGCAVYIFMFSFGQDLPVVIHGAEAKAWV